MLKYKILYTHQKLKKAKTWQDGILKYRLENKKATIYSESGTALDSLFVKPEELVDDADLESDKFLITVECQSKDEQNPNNAITVRATTTNVQSKSCAPFVNKKQPRFQKFHAPSKVEVSKDERPSNQQFYSSGSKQQPSDIPFTNQSLPLPDEKLPQLFSAHTKTTLIRDIEPSPDQSKKRRFDIEQNSAFNEQNYQSMNSYEFQSKQNKNLHSQASFGHNISARVNNFERQLNTGYETTSRNRNPIQLPVNSNNANNNENDILQDCKEYLKKPRTEKRSTNDLLSLFGDSDDDEFFKDSQEIKDCFSSSKIADLRGNPSPSSISERTSYSSKGPNCERTTNDFYTRHSPELVSNEANIEDERCWTGDREKENMVDEETSNHSFPSNKLKRSTSGFFTTQPRNTYGQKFKFEENKTQEVPNLATTSHQPIPSRATTTFPSKPPHSSRFNPSISTHCHSNAQPTSNLHYPKFNPPTTAHSNLNRPGVDYAFPSKEQCKSNPTPQREIKLPLQYESVSQYKQTFKQAILEHLNIILWSTSDRYHKAANNVDLTQLSGTDSVDEPTDPNKPSCKHGPAILRSVKKEGKNKGRMFYTCSASTDKRCNLFQWFDEPNKQNSSKTQTSAVQSAKSRKVTITDYRSLSTMLESHNIQFYGQTKIMRKAMNFFNRKRKEPQARFDRPKKSLYIVLPFKRSSSFYNKADLWVISKTIDFTPGDTFVAKSVFYGPNSSCELEICPLASYSMSQWHENETYYAIQVYNASTELSCIENLEENLRIHDVPVLKHVLLPHEDSTRDQNFHEPKDLSCLDENSIGELIENTIQNFSLNEDQAKALKHISAMFLKQALNSARSAQGNTSFFEELPPNQIKDITLIHGVFGAGKSFLLSVVVLFLLQVFELIEEQQRWESNTLKLMISSTTNVAVDRVLCALLEHGYDDFIRVGSLRKISKRILPNSLHAEDHEDQELRELNTILKSPLTDTEKDYVKKAIEAHKMGANRTRLNRVRVVGVTCAACSFPLLKNLTFQVHLLDECSQMIEPLSMVPIARFHCQRLVLVGDPNQLSPTIQGSESAHPEGLEVTLFERLQKAGLDPIILRCQYRCHPAISLLCSKMFYKGMLTDGVLTDDRGPLLDWLGPVSIADISDGKEATASDGSLFNVKEVQYCVKLVNAILAEGLEPTQVGIITQYKAQVNRISNQLQESGVLSAMELKGVQISTVDAFQGAEKDVIILSCVRTKFIGFINCPRRTNVALSRAKHHLIIVGCHRLLRTDRLWGGVLELAEQEGASFGRGSDALLPPDKYVENKDSITDDFEC